MVTRLVGSEWLGCLLAIYINYLFMTYLYRARYTFCSTTMFYIWLTWLSECYFYSNRSRIRVREILQLYLRWPPQHEYYNNRTYTHRNISIYTILFTSKFRIRFLEIVFFLINIFEHFWNKKKMLLQVLTNFISGEFKKIRTNFTMFLIFFWIIWFSQILAISTMFMRYVYEFEFISKLSF